jgi:hypothetical protein
MISDESSKDRGLPPPGVAAATQEVIITAVAERMGVAAARVRARDRTPQVAAARHAACWALREAGLTPAQIARLFGLQHSTVVHGLTRAQQHPEWQTLVAPVVALAGAGGQQPAVRSWLRYGLRHQPAAISRAVQAYVTCTLLGWERHPGPCCAYGLWLVVRWPPVWAAVAETLQRCDLAPCLGLILVQAARAGYAVADARARGGGGA